TGWIVSVPDSTNSGATGNKLELYKVTRNQDGTANIQNVGTPVPVADYSPPVPAPQQGGAHTIDTLDGRLIHAVSAVDPAHGSTPQSGFVLVKQSPGPEEGFDCWELQKCRWGDYSGALPDPAAPLTGTVGKVWMDNMWADGDIDPLAATWRTWIWAATP